MAITQLWTEKYRPNSVSDYVFTDTNLKNQVDAWIADKSIPNLIFGGGPGTGKTTLAKVLINELNVDPYDVLHINASRDNNVEFVRNKIEGFISTMPFGEFKIVLLDESDFLSQGAQAILRGLIEEYASNARFILTCNYPHKIIPALHSRCQSFVIDKSDATEFTVRAATVLINENVNIDPDILDLYVKATYPDLRKCLNLLQTNSVTGTLVAPGENDRGVQDWKLEAVALFKQNKFREARTLICKQGTEETDSIFKWAYSNLNIWSNTPEGQDEAILIIRKAMVNVSLVADQEVNLAACLVELSQIGI